MRLRYALGALLLAGAGYFALFGGEYGMLEVRRMRADREREQARLADVRAEVDRLEARVDSLENDSATIERIRARTVGAHPSR